jgi:hypothetical protein
MLWRRKGMVASQLGTWGISVGVEDVASFGTQGFALEVLGLPMPAIETYNFLPITITPNSTHQMLI